MEPEAPLERSAGVVVLHPVPLEHLEATAVHRHPHLDRDLTGRRGQGLSQGELQLEQFGGLFVEPLDSFEG